MSVTFGLGAGNGHGTFGAVTDNGHGTYTATFTASTAVGSCTIIGAIGGHPLTSTAPTLNILAGPPIQLSISGPTGATVGNPVQETGTALDAYGNVATGYLGTVQITSTDGEAGLPANYTFQASDAGTHTFSVTMQTPGAQTVTVTDTSNSQFKASVLVYTAEASPPSAQLPTVANDLTHGYQFYYRFVVTAYQQYLGRPPA